MERAFAKILLAYDDSAASRIALAYACALTRAGTTLTVAHTMNTSALVASATSYTGFTSVDPSPLIEALDEQGRAVLAEAVDACATHGVIAEHLFMRDSAAAGIARVARERDVDLIVAGTHGRGGISRTVLGSFAEDLLRSSTVPVLVVTGHTRMPQPQHIFTRALIALDDSAPSRAAVAVAARISNDFLTQLTLCNVIDSRDMLAKAGTYGYDERPFERTWHAESMKLLEQAAKTNTISASADDLVIVEGEPAQAIEHAAMQRNCDLIVLGSHGRNGLQRLFLGSVAEAVVRSSSVPVLVTPAAEHA